jgi:ABC-type microcin C transport system duplicated ATPase subunit YejF
VQRDRYVLKRAAFAAMPFFWILILPSALLTIFLFLVLSFKITIAKQVDDIIMLIALLLSLVTSHVLEFLEDIADYIILLKDGEILEQTGVINTASLEDLYLKHLPEEIPDVPFGGDI